MWVETGVEFCGLEGQSMARALNKLSAMKVGKLKRQGRHADGGGLYLQVGPTGGKSWLFRFTLAGKSREMGLGALDVITIPEAREKALEARRCLAAGKDPIDERDAEKARQKLAQSKGLTFAQCATAYIESHKAGWRNEKHAAQWTATIETYAGPVFGALPVAEVDLTLVSRVLDPIWRTKTETASRLRGRIESILDWAKVQGYREGENPARWKGNLDKVLPARSKVRKVVHHPALPYDDLAEFMKELRQREGLSALALEFTILTAARTSETLKIKWTELDLNAGLWIVPAARMKADRDHRVPLSARAVAILRELAEVRMGEYVFPGQRRGQPLSNMALLKLLERMKRDDLTVHGFRSTFRDWAAECTDFPREVAEAALAHAVGDKVEAAYRRGDLFEKRRQLMEAWAAYCDGQRNNVVALKPVAA
jgi:integrase